jgi:hypothetical protein
VVWIRSLIRNFLPDPDPELEVMVPDKDPDPELDVDLKGTVQRKVTGVLSGINRKLMICHFSDGYSFFNLKGLRSLKSKNVFSALTGTLF